MRTIFENNKAGGWIWTHKASHPEWYRDPCPICFKVIQSAPGAARHINNHGFELKWVCTYTNCEANFYSLQDMRDHVYRHTGTRPYICDASYCKSDYFRRKELKAHTMKAHTIYDHKIATGSWELTPEQRNTVDVANTRADEYIVQILLLDYDGHRKTKSFLDIASAKYHKAKAALEQATRALGGASAAYNAAAASRDASDGQDKFPPQLTTQPLQSPRPSKRRKPNKVSQNKPRLASTTETSVDPTTRLPTPASFLYSNENTAAGHPGGPTATQNSSYPSAPLRNGTPTAGYQGRPIATSMQDASFPSAFPGNGTFAAGYQGRPTATQNSLYTPVSSGNGTSTVGYTENSWESADFNAPESRHYSANYHFQMHTEPMYPQMIQEEMIFGPAKNPPPSFRIPFQNWETEGNRYTDTDTV